VRPGVTQQLAFGIDTEEYPGVKLVPERQHGSDHGTQEQTL